MSVGRLFIRKVLEEVGEKREGLHVTDLVKISICPRMFWLESKNPLPPDLENALRMWHGKKLHEIVLSLHHEMEVELEGVKGRVDEYFPDVGLVVDKKFVTYLPNSKDVEKYYGHYILQLKLYAYMLAANGYPVRECRIIFVNITEKNPLREHVFEPDLDECRSLFEDLREKAMKILASEEPPEIPMLFDPFEYPCSYCNYRSVCYFRDAVMNSAEDA
ncbi:MAG: PD-(D/E)XK nuclease family protein [Candidatus Caldarchaeum sp.]